MKWKYLKFGTGRGWIYPRKKEEATMKFILRLFVERKKKSYSMDQITKSLPRGLGGASHCIYLLVCAKILMMRQFAGARIITKSKSFNKIVKDLIDYD